MIIPIFFSVRQPPVAPSLQSLFEKSKLMNSPSPSGGGVSVIHTSYPQLIFRVLTLSLPNVQVKSSLSAAKAKSKSSSLKESTGASNIHPLIDMSKLLQSQVF